MSSDVLERCTFVKKRKGNYGIVGGGYSSAKKGKAQNFLLLVASRVVWGTAYTGIGW